MSECPWGPRCPVCAFEREWLERRELNAATVAAAAKVANKPAKVASTPAKVANTTGGRSSKKHDIDKTPGRRDKTKPVQTTVGKGQRNTGKVDNNRATNGAERTAKNKGDRRSKANVTQRVSKTQ